MRCLLNLLLVLIPLVFAAGCGEYSVSGRLISSPETTIDLGQVSDVESKEFVISVVASSSCILEEAIVDCGCLAIAEQIHDSRLHAGEVKQIKLLLNPDGQVGYQRHFLRCSAVDDAGKRTQLDFTINYTVIPVPKIEPEGVTLLRFHGEAEYAAQFLVWTRRPANESPRTINFNENSLNGITLVLLSSTTLEANGKTLREYVDERFSYAVKANEQQAHIKSISLQIEPNGQTVEVPISFKKLHPVRPSITQFFIGTVDSGAIQIKSLNLMNISSRPLKIKRVEYHGDGNASLLAQLESLSPGKNDISIKIKTGNGSGRKNGSLHFHFESAEMPPIKLDFAWILN